MRGCGWVGENYRSGEAKKVPRGEWGEKRERVKETGLVSAGFVGEESESGFGGVGFRGAEAVSEGRATFDKVESAGGAGTESRMASRH